MPEMIFKLRWPDGREEACYSPSLVVEDYLSVGVDYPLDDLMDRCRQALSQASARVQARYGFPCSRAEAQLRRLEQQAATFAGGALVRVTAFEK